MPHVVLSTNVQFEDEKVLVQKLGQASAQILGKDITAFLVQYRYDPNLAFAGTFDPAWMLQVGSTRNPADREQYALGVINAEANERYTAEYWEFAQSLALPKDRGYITYFDPGWENWGARGATLAFRDPKRLKA
ncbi:Tautomerase/MIF [Dacryopinax primogenitus]|uniref:L-dopachrome isomerase n=1 Tax=Dacryopinax primogenitus (strain DJM 731) TaxID=1858805 RepID=M5GBM5_DACPD|nr:Tautomerase/MIF [Dacryopinax primogenitus]EJU05815.1 Tautomerase/MIF [Dacryopinax primogenitus]